MCGGGSLISYRPGATSITDLCVFVFGAVYSACLFMAVCLLRSDVMMCVNVNTFVRPQAWRFFYSLQSYSTSCHTGKEGAGVRSVGSTSWEYSTILSDQKTNPQRRAETWGLTHKWRTAREELLTARGEGSDVISPSVILLSKSILCLFVFNIHSPPTPAVFVRGGRRRGGCQMDAQLASCSSRLGSWMIRLWALHWTGLLHFYLSAWMWGVGGPKRLRTRICFKISQHFFSLSFLPPPPFPALSITHVAMAMSRIALTWK